MPGNAKNQRESDSALMMVFAAGDYEGFEVLYRRYSGSIYRFFYFGTHGDRSLTAELFHDVWMTVVRGRIRYTKDINFADWLYHSAWARLHDHIRLHSLERETEVQRVTAKEPKVVSIASRNRAMTELDDEEPEDQSDVTFAAGEFENELMASAPDTAMSETSLLDAIENLNPEQKEVVLLRYCFSMTVQDIADFIDVSKATVDRLARETVSALRQHVSMQQAKSEQLNG